MSPNQPKKWVSKIGNAFYIGYLHQPSTTLTPINPQQPTAMSQDTQPWRAWWQEQRRRNEELVRATQAMTWRDCREKMFFLVGKWNWIMAKIRLFTAKTVDVNKKSRWFWRQINRGFKQERLGFASRIAMIQATKTWTLALSKKNTIKHIQPEKKLGFHLEKWCFFSEEKPWFHQERWGMNRQTSSVFLRNMPTKGFHHDNCWLKPGISGVAVDGTSINHHESQVCCDTSGLLKVNRPIPILEGTHHFTMPQMPQSQLYTTRPWPEAD